MKTLFRALTVAALGLGLLAAAHVNADNDTDTTDDWAMMDEILAGIELPNIPDREFVITDFGAEAGGKKDALPAIKAAIDEAVAAGGGRVIVPTGTFLSQGPIHLKSKIDLHLAKDSKILFSAKTEHYLPIVKTKWEGTEVMGYSPLVYAAKVHDVAITGPGMLDGNAKSQFKKWHKKQDDDIHTLRTMGATGVPLEQRIFGEGTYLRPVFVQFMDAERVLLDGYSIINAPFWINHLVYTQSATVRNLKVDSHFPNNDGIDVESSSNVLVENNYFRTGDDSVVVKSGRDLDGRTIGIPSTNVVVRNNDMGGEDGIGLGSEMSGGIKNVFFTDNVLRQGLSAFRFKSNLDRGGLVENIRVRNFTVESFDTLFWFQMYYPSKLGLNFPSTYRNIVFENIEVESAGTFLEVHAPAAAPLEDVTFKNIVVKSVETPLILENAKDLHFENVQIGDQVVNGNLSWHAKQE
ncbi:glycoside hydrolase family 28 protein [Gilvimarinus algae]|uniref:Glycoside hydrolase family 28 protein n=1 Tax=Gilvimarinus algae TaxID=3058037 RepID=A0ABT8TEI2_9GAMM|nr:glycoside hydrolase family 28 protein [Gilvimarinus sp. SDUM040014]MDO3380712.1 glycoside hydrolase family 28 protein [Gilvimarinus sp. SDUM040014]